MRTQRHTVGCVRYDKRRRTWNYLFYDQGKRRSKRIGSKQQYPTKAAAWKAVTPAESQPQPSRASTAPTVAALVEQYQVEKMPKRYSTRRSYDAWLRNHVLPKFGTCPLSDVQARPAELWLESLNLTPRSRAAVRGLLRILGLRYVARRRSHAAQPDGAGQDQGRVKTNEQTAQSYGGRIPTVQRSPRGTVSLHRPCVRLLRPSHQRGAGAAMVRR